jgi:hypothetical protein
VRPPAEFVTTADILPTGVVRSRGNRHLGAAATPLHLENGAQVILVDLVPEALDAVDLDQRNPLAVPPLEVGIGRDVDKLEIVTAHGPDSLDGGLTEMAPGRRVHDDARRIGVSR